jgi:NAD(P)H-hydrate repair Nnr-like enzyme with NAD(P)H-hydrate dehydratase domain
VLTVLLGALLTARLSPRERTAVAAAYLQDLAGRRAPSPRRTSPPS